MVKGATMRRFGRIPVFLIALVFGSLLVGPTARPVSADVGESVFASVTGAVGVAATPGRVYVTSPSSSGQTQVSEFDDTGSRVFVTLPSFRPAGAEEYVAVAGPKDPSAGGFPTPTLGGFPSNYVYVTQGQNIIEITQNGVISRNPFATISSCQSDRTGITFDHVGSFGYNMIVTCLNGTVWKVDKNANATLIVNVATALGLASVHIENPDVAPLSFGAYGGYVFVAAGDLDRVLAISPSGAVTRVARWASAEGVNFIPSAKCTFGTSTATYFTVISPSSVYQFPLTAFLGLSGNAIVTSEGNAGMGLLSTQNIKKFHNSLGSHEGSAFVDCGVPRLVGLRVDPGSNTPRSINPRSNGTTQFAILASPAFAVTSIDFTTVTFGFTGNESSVVAGSCSTFRDVDGDGLLDVICRAYNNRLGIPAGALNPSGVYSGPLVVKFNYTAPGGDPGGEGLD